MLQLWHDAPVCDRDGLQTLVPIMFILIIPILVIDSAFW